MRALVARRLDGPDALELIDTETPSPAAGHVLVKVAAAAINPVDLVATDGTLVEYGITVPREQFGLGWDVAGTVEAAGPGVELAVGTPVIGLSDLVGRPLKTHAEYVVLNAGAVASVSPEVDLVAASTVPLNALTSLQALDRLGLNPGQSLLVTGAAGGVGGYAVELGKHQGLTVVASAGSADEELVRGFGADYFVPRSADLTSAVHGVFPAGVDAVIDAAVLGVGAQEPVRNRGAHVHLVAVGAPPPLRGITVHSVFVQADRPQLEQVARLLEAGTISARVAETYPLSDAASAYKRLAAGGVRGRVVLVP